MPLFKILIEFLLYSFVIFSSISNYNLFDSDKYKKAEAAFEKKNYSEAKTLYIEAMALEKDSVIIKTIQYKIGLCLAFLKEHDEFYKFIQPFRNSNLGNIWEAKSYYLEGMYNSMAYPYSRASGVESFKKCRELYNKFIGSKILTEKDLMDLDILLADRLEFTIGRYYYWDYDEIKSDNDFLKELKEIEEKSLKIDTGNYSRDWETRKQIVYIYRELMNLTLKEEKNYYITYYDFGNYLRRVGRTDVYSNEALKILKEVVSKSNETDLRAKAQYVIALLYQNIGNLIKSVEEYEKLIANFQKSNYVQDAQNNIQNIKKPVLTISSKTQFRLDDTVKFEINSKNISQVSFDVYEINLPEILRNRLKTKEVDINDFSRLFDDSKGLLKKVDKKVISWDKKIEDKKDYKNVKTEVKLPNDVLNKKVGQYAVIANYENNYAAAILIISDIILVERSEHNKTHYFIADSRTGKPVENADIFIRYNSYYSNTKSENGKTDKMGRYSSTFTGNNFSNAVCFAYKGKSFAATNDFYISSYRKSKKEILKYTITDRPVYRPNQKVYFKHIIKNETEGQYFPLKDVEVTVIIRDPKYQEVYKKTLKTNEFGSIYGEYEIPEDAPLGMYNFLLKASGESYEDYVQSFRVEEYKRPEFEIKIEPISEKIKVGQNLKIKIHAEYYFGGPVQNAEVNYTVRKSRYRQFFYSRNSFDWLYGNGFAEDRRYRRYWWYYDNRETVVETKTVKTDEEGNVILNYETESLLKEDWTDDFQYKIDVKITDASRRVIEGQKNIIIPKKEFNVFIKNERGYISTNEKARFNIFALTPNYTPIKAAGKITVLKLIPKKAEKENIYDEEKILETRLTLEDGKADYVYQPGTPGKYKITYETKDSDNDTVRAELDFWVIDRNFSGKSYFFDNLEIISEKGVYKEDEIVNLMINTDKPGSYVWLSLEAENFIIKEEVIYLEGKSKIYSFKLNKSFVPNFFITGYVISDESVFTENKQIYVPPERQFVKVELKSNKEEYRPGEKAKLEITTKNYKGEPITSELSLSAVDASIFYIQNILTPDIRTFYYGSLRYNNISTVNSLDFRINSRSDDYNYYKEYTLHGYPDGFYRMSRLLRYYADLNKPGEAFEEDAKFGVNELQQSKSEAIPPLAVPKLAKKDGERASGLTDKKAKGGKDEEEVKIREKFNETVLWKPVILTDKNGKAEIEFDFNDALTLWQISAKTTTLGSEVGETSINVRTKKELLVRLQAPRFFQEKDEVVLSANVHNYSKNEKNIDVSIDISGGTLELLEKTNTYKIKVKANGEQRVDWKARVLKPGNATLIVKAIAPDDNDAVKMEFPVLEYGIEKFYAINGDLRNKNEEIYEIDIPKDIRQNSQKIEFSIAPSLATITLSALPYLINYPYGCFEQTLSRFVPAVVVAKTLEDMKINLNDISEYNQKINQKLLPNWSPVYSKKELKKVIDEGLKRIYNFQNHDGGFSWWPGYSSDPYMTSHGLVALSYAKRANIDVNQNVIERSLNYLITYVNTKENIDENTKAYMYYAISCFKPEKVDLKGLDEMFRLRDHITLYSFALLGLTYENIILKDLGKFNIASLDHPIGIEKPLKDYNLKNKSFNNMSIIRENLLDKIKIDNQNKTAYWNPESRYYWWWYNDRLETTVMILKFLNHVDPKNDILPKIVKWLINNRRGNAWNSTKDSGLAIEVLMEYIRLNKELEVDYTIQVLIDDKKIKEFKVNKENLFTFDNTIILSGEEISSGKHKIKIIKQGTGNVYYSTFISYFTREEKITGSGNEIAISRSYFKLIPEEKTINDRKIIEYKEVPLQFGEILKSGDEIRVKLTIESKNDYQYLVFEDRKPSGCEFKLLRSWGGYMELRDEKVVFFESYLRQGKNYVNYDMRAEIPGIFYVMPTNGYAMYTPDIRAISDAFKMNIIDK